MVSASGTWSSALARVVSILGHPAVLMPAATLRAFDGQRVPHAAMSVAAVAALAAGLMLWSGWQVRRGRWAHVDASQPSERRDWNRAVFVVLAAGGAVAAGMRFGVLAIGLGCAAVIVGLAVVSAARLKLSQHVAFATMAVFVVAPRSVAAIAAAGAIVLAIAWSRRRLGRHTKNEVIAGLGAGLVAGIIFRLAIVALG